MNRISSSVSANRLLSNLPRRELPALNNLPPENVATNVAGAVRTARRPKIESGDFAHDNNGGRLNSHRARLFDNIVQGSSRDNRFAERSALGDGDGNVRRHTGADEFAHDTFESV